jgi:hypothetical protein
MPYFRIHYEGYVEGEYPDGGDALVEFKEVVREDLDDVNNILVEKWDGKEWEVI